ncbi:CCN family member 5 isoform X2 [Protopterus annectens]|uniref:CCN family member 5 isoform X2 n=1 Tax=Protopterus annectens TaxID=7888 RepID=UPI001CFAD1AA|nr:CCN family member 5 isoform X2 [Protopterus annectens]
MLGHCYLINHYKKRKMKPENQVIPYLCFLCILPEIIAQLCPRPCYCPWSPLRCPAHVPRVIDGCGCCMICAKRLGELCNHMYVCDQTEGLTCDFSTPYPWRPGWGVCNYDEGCEVDGKVYKEGDVFQPSCKFQCRCSDGGITCIPLCTEDVRLPSPDCPYPRRVEIPGKCCKEWICEKRENRILHHAMTASTVTDVKPGGDSIHEHPNCVEQVEEWSVCSVSCGMGISTRLSNQNQECRLQIERRLCFMRPCHGYWRGIAF